MREPQLTAGGRVRRIAVLVACALLIALMLPAAASAKRGLVTGIGDVEGTDGAERATWLDRAVTARVGIVRVGIQWPNVVTPTRPPDPTNPDSLSYDLTSIDVAVRAIAARGMNVLLTVNRAPTWAEAPGRPASATPGTWKPNPSDLADFMQALARRYSGDFDPDGAGPAPPLPAIHSLEVWGEINLEDWLSPQYEGKTAVSVGHYRNMLNASYDAVKAVAPRILVTTGATAPFGDPPGGPYPPGGARVRPVQFWQQLLCVHAVKTKKKKKKTKKKSASQRKYVRTKGCPSPPRFDVLVHHPINNMPGGPRFSAPNRDDSSTPDLGRVVAVLRAAERVGTVSGGRHPVWVTEFWWDSKPPNSVGAPLGQHARWIQESLYLFWKAGASVAINFQLRDIPDRENERAGHQSGLFFADGQQKPAFTAFRFPFVTERINDQTLRAWGRAPRGGKLVIQRKAGGRWVAVKKIKVGEGAVFVAKLRLRGKQRLRAQVGGERSLVWKQAGAATRNSGSGGGGPSATTIIPLLIATILVVVVATALLRRRQPRRRRRVRPMTG